MARTANPPLPALPFDVRLAQVGANVLLALLAAALLGGAALWLVRLPAFDLRGIVIEGDLAHNSPLTMRAIVAPKLSGSFLSLDLARARAAFETVPWVRRATVRRLWPDRLAVQIEEHRVAALWNADTSDEALVNSQGEVFEANLGDVEDDALPRLSGPAGSAARVLAMWRALAPLMQPLGSPIESLRLSGHGSWRAMAQIDDGAVPSAVRSVAAGQPVVLCDVRRHQSAGVAGARRGGAEVDADRGRRLLRRVDPRALAAVPVSTLR